MTTGLTGPTLQYGRQGTPLSLFSPPLLLPLMCRPASFFFSISLFLSLSLSLSLHCLLIFSHTYSLEHL